MIFQILCSGGTPSGLLRNPTALSFDPEKVLTVRSFLRNLLTIEAFYSIPTAVCSSYPINTQASSHNLIDTNFVA
jgi:hypothetical protein